MLSRPVQNDSTNAAISADGVGCLGQCVEGFEIDRVQFSGSIEHDFGDPVANGDFDAICHESSARHALIVHLPFFSTTVLRSRTLQLKDTTLPSCHMSVVIVSPGSTGAENRPSMASISV